MDYFNSRLPEEITSNILARLPTEAVLDSKLVCTRWRNAVSNDRSFSKMHLHHHLNHPSAAAQDSSCKLGFLALSDDDNKKTELFYYFEYNEENHDNDEESTKPIQGIKRIKFTSPFRENSLGGSCNGLVCLVSYQDVCIFNPITREYVILPKVIADCQYNFGFGYASSTNEYKVLLILVKGTKGEEEAYIYTLGSGNGWRNLGNFNFEFDFCRIREPGIFANEALYWMDDKSKMIVHFDLAEEKFCEHLSLPPSPPDNIWYNNGIGVLNGHLCFGLYDETGFYDIWLLEKKNHINHGMEEGEEHQSLGWRKEFRIDDMLLLANTNSEGVLTYDGNYYINIYNTKTSTLRRLVKFKNWIRRVFPHENTLVSLKELEEEDTKIMEPIEETKSREQLQEDADHEYIFL